MARFDRWLRRLDWVQVAPGMALGVFAGMAAGGLLLWQPTLPRAITAAALALGAIPLARAGRPAGEEIPRPRAPTSEARQVPLPPLAPEPSPYQEGPIDTQPRVPSLLDMVELPGGEFWMGSRDEDSQAFESEKPRHHVQVGPFAIGRTQITQAEYARVMGAARGTPKGDKLPANEVTWFDAVAFCNRLSTSEGLQPAYEVHGENVAWNPQANGYRLATEAEWEYAARAGTDTAWSFGDNESDLGEHAWYFANSNNQVQPVG